MTICVSSTSTSLSKCIHTIEYLSTLSWTLNIGHQNLHVVSFWNFKFHGMKQKTLLQDLEIPFYIKSPQQHLLNQDYAEELFLHLEPVFCLQDLSTASTIQHIGLNLLTELCLTLNHVRNLSDGLQVHYVNKTSKYDSEMVSRAAPVEFISILTSSPQRMTLWDQPATWINNKLATICIVTLVNKFSRFPYNACSILVSHANEPLSGINSKELYLPSSQRPSAS